MNRILPRGLGPKKDRQLKPLAKGNTARSSHYTGSSKSPVPSAKLNNSSVENVQMSMQEPVRGSISSQAGIENSSVTNAQFVSTHIVEQASPINTLNPPDQQTEQQPPVPHT